MYSSDFIENLTDTLYVYLGIVYKTDRSEYAVRVQSCYWVSVEVTIKEQILIHLLLHKNVSLNECEIYLLVVVDSMLRR